MKNQLALSQAINGYLMYAAARHLSQNTIRNYSLAFQKFSKYLGSDPPLVSITHFQVEGFLSTFEDLSNKTLLNYHISLSALWTWAVKEKIASEQIVHQVARPKPEKREIIPFSDLDLRQMVDFLARSRSYHRPGKRESFHTLKFPERNQAMYYLLLDTGIRNSELCDMKIHDCDLKNLRITVFGKGARERTIPISHRTAQIVFRYLSTRPDARLDFPLLATEYNRPLEPFNIDHILDRLGERSGVPDCHAHRFRHTFAILYLRNGGDPFTLQRILGHSTLTMVNRYLHIAQTDLAQAHRRASPVDNLRL